MKRLSLVALLLFGSVAAARADNDIYTNMSKQKRGDDALHADAAVCDAQFGAPQNGTPTCGNTRAACAPAAGASATPFARCAGTTTAIQIPTIPASSATILRSAASPDRAVRIFEMMARRFLVRHPEEREARLEGSTAPLVAVHPSRLAPLAPPAAKAKPLRGDDGLREKQSARRGRPPGR
ncbi:hypothetical protein AAFG13_14760 [Bradyrhizobium sp. B124]|uniref:hypothetical protein n=1 Tax=Bradyrhizobium sp. B124 TaxID=3140245 RepID=UPI0031840EB1